MLFESFETNALWRVSKGMNAELKDKPVLDGGLARGIPEAEDCRAT